MSDVIDGLKNHNTREAKDFVVSRFPGRTREKIQIVHAEEELQIARHRRRMMVTAR
jgi:hypothetical protein